MGELTVLPVPVSRPQDPAGRRRPADKDGFDTLLATDEALVSAASSPTGGLRREEPQPSKRRTLGDLVYDQGLGADGTGGLGQSTLPVDRPHRETMAGDGAAAPGRGSAPNQRPAGVPQVGWAAPAEAAAAAATTEVAAPPPWTADPVAVAPGAELPGGLAPEVTARVGADDLPVGLPAAEGVTTVDGRMAVATASPATTGPRASRTDAVPALGPAGAPGQGKGTDTVDPSQAAAVTGPHPTSGSAPDHLGQTAPGRGDSPTGAARTPSSGDVVAPRAGAGPDSSAPGQPPFPSPSTGSAAPVGLQPGSGGPTAPSPDSQQPFPASGLASPAGTSVVPERGDPHRAHPEGDPLGSGPAQPAAPAAAAAAAVSGPLAGSGGGDGPAPIRLGAAPSPSLPPPADQLAQVVSPLRGAPDGSYTLRLALRPRELGPVEVSVTMRDGTLGLVLHSDDTTAQQVLRDALGQLREALTDAGVDLGRLDVADARTGDPESRGTGTGPGSRDAAASGQLARPPVDAFDPAVVPRRSPDASRHRAGLDLRL